METPTHTQLDDRLFEFIDTISCYEAEEIWNAFDRLSLDLDKTVLVTHLEKLLDILAESLT